MLLKYEDLKEFLMCPKSSNGIYKSNNDSLVFSDLEDRSYEVWKNLPIVIDFNKSIVSYNDIKSLDSVVNRNSYGGIFSIIKKLISPSKKVTQENVFTILKNLCGQEKPRVLIVGGGTIGQGMDYFYNSPNINLISFDIYSSPNVNLIADAHNIPLKDRIFDLVIVQAVLEHVLDPTEVVDEIYRVLKQGGIVYSETPFLQQVHEGAYDFIRFTESGHRYLFRKFQIINSGFSAGTGTQFLWSLDYFFRGLFRSRKVGKVIKLCFFWLRYFDYLIPDHFNIDSASGVFFLGKKHQSEFSVRDVPDYYKGAQ